MKLGLAISQKLTEIRIRLQSFLFRDKRSNRHLTVKNLSDTAFPAMIEAENNSLPLRATSRKRA
jgi:hypothetical protein